MVLKALQLNLEQRFNKDWVEENYKEESWFGIIGSKLGHLEPENKEEEEELDSIIKLSCHIMYILAERGNVMYHNLIEMCMNKSDRDESIVFASKVLDLGAEIGLWKYDQLPVNDNALKVRALWGVPDNVKQALDECMYPVPMVIEPRKVRNNWNNRGSGYLLNRYDSLILKNKWHKGDICREFLDKANSVSLTLNQDIIQLFEHGLNLAKIKAKVELSGQSSWEAMAQAEKNWDMYKEQTSLVASILKDKKFYLTHKYDSRGRCYAQGFHVNYQGDSYCKAMIELANKEEISQSINFNLD